MPNVYLSILKKVFSVGLPKIVGQLTSGINFFNYLTLGTDNTETEGANIVSGLVTGFPDAGVNFKTVNWIDPILSRTVSTVYKYGLKTPEPGTEAISPFVVGYTVEPFIMVDGVYVGRLPSNKYAPAHIQNIAGDDYLISYVIIGNGGLDGFRVAKYKLLLDMLVDQTAAPLLTFDKEITYTDTSSAEAAYQADSVPNPFGDSGVAPDNTESTAYFAMHERQLVPNADGSKTILFIMRKYAGVWKGFPIFELTDTETTWSIAEIGEFINTYDEVEGANSIYFTQSGSTNRLVTATVDQSTCPGGPVVVDHVGTWSGSKSGTAGETIAGTRSKYFLGCAYNRKTDSPIILQLHHGEKEYIYNTTVSASLTGGVTYYEIGGSSSAALTNTMIQNANLTTISNGKHGDNQIFKLITSDVDGVTNQNAIISTDATSSITITGTQITTNLYDDGYLFQYFIGDQNFDYDFTVNYKSVKDFNVISLANLAVAYLTQVINDSYNFTNLTTTNSYDTLQTILSKSLWDTTDDLIISVDGVETILNSSASTKDNYIATSEGFSFSATIDPNALRTPTTCLFQCDGCTTQTEESTFIYA